MDLYNTDKTHIYTYTYVSDTVSTVDAHGPGARPGCGQATPAVTGCGHCGRGRHRHRIEALQHANRPLIDLASKSTGLVAASAAVGAAAVACAPRGTAVAAASAAAAPAVAVAVTPAGAFFGFIGEAAQPAAASVQASAAFSVRSKVLSRLASILMKRL